MEKVTAAEVANQIRSYSYNETLEQIKNNTDWQSQSCAIVNNDDMQVFGVISEADILQAEKDNKNLKAIHAWEICSHEILSVNQKAKIKDVIALMLKNQVHHILVRNEENEQGPQYTGIISTLDILRMVYDKKIIN